MRRIALLLLGVSWVQANTDGVEVICGQEYVGDVTGPLMCEHNSGLISNKDLRADSALRQPESLESQKPGWWVFLHEG